jgi:hypothetical protein
MACFFFPAEKVSAIADKSSTIVDTFSATGICWAIAASAMWMSISPYIPDIVLDLPSGNEVSVFTFIYMAVAGHCFVYEAECQVYGLGDGVSGV